MRDDVLTATDVRRQLAEALAPIREKCEQALADRDRAALRYVVQLHPLVVQVTRVPDEGRPAQSLGALDVSTLPDRGAALGVAAEAFATGILSALPTQAAEAVMLNAVAAVGGGLVVVFDPTDETAMLIVAEAGKSLGEAPIVGGIVDAPETLH